VCSKFGKEGLIAILSKPPVVYDGWLDEIINEFSRPELMR